MGEENETEVNDCSIFFVKEIMKIEEVKKRDEQTAEETRLLKKGPANKRESAPYCHHCNEIQGVSANSVGAMSVEVKKILTSKSCATSAIYPIIFIV